MTSPVRLIDGDWHFRCESCARKKKQCLWPLAREFWDPEAMTKCLACHREDKRIRQHGYLANETPEQRARRLQRVRDYRVEAKDVISAKRRLLPEEIKALRRAKERERRANETPEQRAKRLAYVRDWQRAHPERMRVLKREYKQRLRERAA